jgi:hypothetical protein
MRRLAWQRFVSAGFLYGLIVSMAAYSGAATIDRFLADDVVAVGSVDLTKLDILATFEAFVELGIVPQPWIQQERETASAAQKAYVQLPRAGAKRIYAVIRSTDVVHGGTSWVVELRDDADATRVVELLEQWADKGRRERSFDELSDALPTKFEAAGNVVLAASTDEQLTALKGARSTAPRADALAAVKTLLQADVGLVLFGDRDSRRVVREMFPSLPAPFMEVDGRLLAEGVPWGGVLVKLPPGPTIGLIVEAATSEVAKTLEESATKALELLKGICLAEVVKGSPQAAGALPVLALLKPQVDGTRLTLTIGDDKAEVDAIHTVLVPALGKARESAARSERVNNLKYLALAMFNYHDAKGSFPPAAIYDAHGKPLLSWRVALLPYLEHQGEMQALYQEFHLDEPWDSEHNRPLIAKMPKVFATSGALASGGRTTLVVPMGEETAFHGAEGTKLADIKDGGSKTILIVEAVPERAVVWTKPEDWEIDLKNPLRGVKQDGGAAGGVFAAAFCDGHVQVLSDDIDPKTLAGLLTIAGGENVLP